MARVAIVAEFPVKYFCFLSRRDFVVEPATVATLHTNLLLVLPLTAVY